MSFKSVVGLATLFVGLLAPAAGACPTQYAQQGPTRCALKPQEQYLVYLDLGRLYRQQESYRQAEQAFEAARYLGDPVEPLIELGVTQSTRQNPAAAAVYFQEALALLQAQPQLSLIDRLAYEQIQAEDWSGARSALLLSLSQVNSAAKNLQLGQVYQKLAQDQLATAAFGKAHQLYLQTQALAPVALATGLRETQQLRLAESWLRQYLKRGQNTAIETAQFQTELGLILALQQRPDANLYLEQATRQVDILDSGYKLMLASAWREQKNYAVAADIYQRLIDQTPRRFDRVLALADSLFQIEDPRAERFYLIAYDILPGKADDGQLRTLAYGLKDFDPSKSLNSFQQIQSPKIQDWLEQGYLLRALQRDPEALSAFQSASQYLASDTPVTVYQSLAYHLIQLQAYPEALSVLQMQERNSQTPFPHALQLAQVYFALEQPAQARIALAELIQNPPDSADDRLSLAAVLVEQEQSQAALRLLQPFPVKSAARDLLLAEIYRQRQQESQALALLRPLVSQSKGLSLSQQRQLALALLDLEQHQSARALLLNLPDQQTLNPRTAIDYSQDAEWQIALARSYLPDDAQQAQPYLQQAEQILTQQDRPPLRLLKQLGYAYHLSKAYADSRQVYTQVLERSPADRDALTIQAYHWDQSGRFSQALAAYDRVLKLYPQEKEVHFNRGLIYQAMGQRWQALADFRQSAPQASLQCQACKLSQQLFRQQWALNSILDQDLNLQAGTQDLFIGGNYSRFIVSSAQSNLEWNLNNPWDAHQPDLLAELNAGLSRHQELGTDNWFSFNRYQVGTALSMTQYPESGPHRWQIKPSFDYHYAQADPAEIAAVQSGRLKLITNLDPVRQWRLGLGGELAFGQADLFLGAFYNYGAEAKISWFPDLWEFTYLAGLQNYQFLSAADQVRQVYRQLNSLQVVYFGEPFAYRGNFDISPIFGELTDLNLNSLQRVQFHLTDQLALKAEAESHHYLSQEQRFQNVLSLQAAGSWKLPLPWQFPLYLQIGTRWNWFYSGDQTPTPNLFINLRSEDGV